MVDRPRAFLLVGADRLVVRGDPRRADHRPVETRPDVVSTAGSLLRRADAATFAFTRNASPSRSLASGAWSAVSSTRARRCQLANVECRSTVTAWPWAPPAVQGQLHAAQRLVAGVERRSQRRPRPVDPVPARRRASGCTVTTATTIPATTSRTSARTSHRSRRRIERPTISGPPPDFMYLGARPPPRRRPQACARTSSSTWVPCRSSFTGPIPGRARSASRVAGRVGDRPQRRVRENQVGRHASGAGQVATPVPQRDQQRLRRCRRVGAPTSRAGLGQSGPWVGRRGPGARVRGGLDRREPRARRAAHRPQPQGARPRPGAVQDELGAAARHVQAATLLGARRRRVGVRDGDQAPSSPVTNTVRNSRPLPGGR